MSETTNLVDNAVAQEAFASEAKPQQTKAEPSPLVTPTEKSYTEGDLQKVREQEKSKLYPQIDSLKEEVNFLKKRDEEREAETTRAKLESEAEAKRKAESEMDVRTLLETKEKEWEAQLESIRQDAARKDALLERERQYAELTAYRSRRLEEERDNIIPELVDLISGNTHDEVENSITGLRERSAKILESAQKAIQDQRRDMTGTRTTLPPTMENNSDSQSFTADQISAMSVTEYAKHRGKLMGDSANSKNKGIFG